MDTISFGDSKIMPLDYKYYKCLLKGKKQKYIRLTKSWDLIKWFTVWSRLKSK